MKRGKRKMAARLSWTASALLPVSFTHRIFRSYVCPSALYGLAFVPDGAQLARLQTRLLRWERRLLMWPHGAPSVVVQGQLGCLDLSAERLLHAAGMWARLICMPARSVARRIMHHAASQRSSWIASVQDELASLDIPHPHSFGLRPGAPNNVAVRWLMHVKATGTLHCHARYQAALQSTESLQNYLRWPPRPHLHAVLYGKSIDPAQGIMTFRMAALRAIVACDLVDFVLPPLTHSSMLCWVALRTIMRASDGAVTCATRCLWTHCSARSPMSMPHAASRAMLHLWLMYALPLRRVRCECAS